MGWAAALLIRLVPMPQLVSVLVWSATLIIAGSRTVPLLALVVPRAIAGVDG